MSKENYKHKLTLPSDTELHIEREFNAPAELVYNAFLNPDLIVQWWGPRKYTTTVDKLEPFVGGKWRFIHKNEEGEFAFRGEFKELDPYTKISYTFEFEPMEGHILLETAVLEELNGKTMVKITDTFSSKEDRDGMIQSGMEEGMSESYERLDELLEKMK